MFSEYGGRSRVRGVPPGEDTATYLHRSVKSSQPTTRSKVALDHFIAPGCHGDVTRIDLLRKDLFYVRLMPPQGGIEETQVLEFAR